MSRKRSANDKKYFHFAVHVCMYAWECARLCHLRGKVDDRRGLVKGQCRASPPLLLVAQNRAVARSASKSGRQRPRARQFWAHLAAL